MLRNEQCLSKKLGEFAREKRKYFFHFLDFFFFFFQYQILYSDKFLPDHVTTGIQYMRHVGYRK